MWDPYADFRSEQLPNGLNVYAAYWPRPWEALGFMVHSGAEHDPVGLEGLAHFVEHLVSENASIAKSDILDFFGDCGGTIGLGRTSYPATRYHAFVPISNYVLAKAFDIFGQMMLTAKLEKMIERERQVIMGEFHRQYPVKFSLDLDIRARRSLYSGHWLERFVRPLGQPESITKITLHDLQTHYDAHYVPANISIVGVGGIQLDDLVAIISKSPFAMTKPGVRTQLPQPILHFEPPTETRYVFELSQYVKMAEQASIGAYASIARIPGNVNQRSISILKDMFDEALNDEVRERRAWTYAINSEHMNFRSINEFAIECRSLVPLAMDEIENVIEVCIADMQDRANWFERAKKRALASNFMIDPTGQGIRNGALDDLANYQRVISLAEYGNDINRVTMDDVRELLQYLSPERRWTLITKP